MGFGLELSRIIVFLITYPSLEVYRSDRSDRFVSRSGVVGTPWNNSDRGMTGYCGSSLGKYKNQQFTASETESEQPTAGATSSFQNEILLTRKSIMQGRGTCTLDIIFGGSYCCNAGAERNRKSKVACTYTNTEILSPTTRCT